MPKIKHRPALYVTIPRLLAFDARYHTFDPFELAVIGGILSAAHIAREEERHAARFAKGALAIQKERELADKHKSDWQKVRQQRRRGFGAKAPVRRHVHKKATYKAGHQGRNLTAAGSYAYRKARDKQGAAQLSCGFSIVMSKSRLLTIAGLSRDGGNMVRLSQTLRKLTEPTSIDGHKFTPLLIDFHASPSDKLLLEVSTDWFELQYVRAPIPLPTKSSHACALYLFHLCISTNSIDQKDISFASLCHRIGIRAARFRQRTFDRALAVVNHHLGRLDEDALHGQRLRLPGSLEIEGSGYRIRLRGIPRPYRGEQACSQLPQRKPLTRFRAQNRDDDPAERLPPSGSIWDRIDEKRRRRERERAE